MAIGSTDAIEDARDPAVALRADEIVTAGAVFMGTKPALVWRRLEELRRELTGLQKRAVALAEKYDVDEASSVSSTRTSHSWSGRLSVRIPLMNRMNAV